MSGELRHVTSPDGTRIAVERVGSGPDLVAIHGGTADRSRWAPVLPALAERFTVHVLDRRGRGDSADEATGPYSVGLEAEDLLAVVADIGRPVGLLGHSYGGAVVLDALPKAGSAVGALIYDPAFGPRLTPPGALDRLRDLVDAGEREQALETFYREVLALDPTPLKSLPIWQARIAAVHTIVREGEAALDYTPSADDLAGVTMPVRVLLGAQSPAPFREAVDSVLSALPGAELVDLPGQGHVMIDSDPDGFVDRVTEFFTPERWG